MIYHGKIQGGVVVLQPGATLPEGTEVTVIPSSEVAAAGQGSTVSIWDRLVKLAQWTETQPCSLPADLATNHDHYLHGLPKRQ